MQPSARYTLAFTMLVSVVGSIFVASTAVLLEDRQDANRLLDRRTKVLDVAGLVLPGERVSSEDVNDRFAANIRPLIVDLESGDEVTDVDIEEFDQRSATQDPATSRSAPANAAGIVRLPELALLYHVVEGDEITAVILPIEGQGLWSTMYGFIALSADLETINGITFYEHGETPGLGGEIDNPSWKASWQGRKAFDEQWIPRIEVLKGAAPPADQAPYQVDGLAGSTLTARGVSNTVQFWLSDEGFGPYLERYRRDRGIT